ncbi:MAG: DUF1998 domain-containing protein [Thermodesulfobacteriota bacterium]
MCIRCGTKLTVANSDHIPHLFEMTAVATEHRDRIVSDEEVRQSEQYKIQTYYRFATKKGKERSSKAKAISSDEKTPLLTLEFGRAAELWRINHGWERAEVPGFTLDIVSGKWSGAAVPDGGNAAGGDQKNLQSGVRVFVRDRRNILVVKVERGAGLGDDAFYSLQHAIARGTCLEFDIDEREIGSEIIGEGSWRRIVYWEEAEGGTGSLERWIEEPDALPRITRRALETCHFDPDTGAEVKTESQCHVACYECLMTYRNQPHHDRLDRHAVKDLLMRLAQGSVKPK